MNSKGMRGIPFLCKLFGHKYNEHTVNKRGEGRRITHTNCVRCENKYQNIIIREAKLYVSNKVR